MKKGFTLIELLAVIVILAIIAVIAVPIVLNIINEAKDNIKKRSIDMYAKAIENAVYRYQINTGKIPNDYEELSTYIEYSGSEITCDDFRIYTDGSIYLNKCKLDSEYVENYSKGSPIGDGTLAYDIVSKYGGISNISEIDLLEKDHRIVEYNKSIYINSSQVTTFGTSYNYNESENKYTLSGNLVQATLTECRNGKKSDGTTINCGKYVLLYNNNCVYEILDFKQSGNPIANTIKYVNEYGGYIFESNLYKMEDDLGMSYYYRGVTDNNYVKFGTYANDTTISNATITKGSPIYWKIVRINGDGTIRLAYAGIELNETSGGYIKSISTNYIKSEGDKDILNWYNVNLNTNYSKYISDGIFCNNDEDIELTEFENIEPDENGNIPFISKSYNSKLRIDNNTPSLKCTKGNVAKVDLISAEEIYVVGDNYILEDWEASGELGYYCTSTYSLVDNYSLMMGYDSTKYYKWYYMMIGYSYGTVLESAGTSAPSCSKYTPVINLKADVKFKGDGSRTNPYEIIIE